MEEKPAEVVDVIKKNRTKQMKNTFLLIAMFFMTFAFSQQQSNDSLKAYKKRVLEKIEVDFLSSYYSQDGANAAVTGGIGTEELTDLATDITVSIPLNEDDILTINAEVSAYTSASSSNLDPFDKSGASTGSPWVESSGDSRKDTWVHGKVNYSHSSDDRNKIWSANVNFAAEYDYTSIGFGGSHSWLFNEKNTEFSINGNVYLDTWNPKYPTELDSYFEADQNLNNGFFLGVDILNQDGDIIDKDGPTVWSPLNDTGG